MDNINMNLKEIGFQGADWLKMWFIGRKGLRNANELSGFHNRRRIS
jgi:hypothetical protein